MELRLMRLWINWREVPSAQSKRWVMPPRRRAVQEALRCMVGEPEDVPRKEMQNSLLFWGEVSVRQVRR